MSTEVSIVIPTFNEKDNIKVLVNNISNILKKEEIAYEIVIVDDNSPDGTTQAAKELSNEYPIKLITRVNIKGLGSAIIDGINVSSGQIICVMDADLSHPASALPNMYKIIKEKRAQLVIGSRLVESGGTSKWIWYRKFAHFVARQIGSFLTPIKDVTSGFFMFNKDIIKNVKLEPSSWKIGLEIIVKGKYEKAIEYPIVFIERESGKSKMSSKEAIAYIFHVLKLAIYKLLRA